MAFYDSDEELLNFISEDDFATTITKADTSTFKAIFDAEQEVFDVNTGQVVNSSPVITGRTSDMSGLSRGDVVIVNSISYNVLDNKDDRTGMSTMAVSTK